MPYVRRTTPAESDEEFIVETILNCRGRGGSTEYLVKWEEYEEPSWTWYFKCNCPERLAEFRHQRRLDRRYQQARNDPCVGDVAGLVEFKRGGHLHRHQVFGLEKSQKIANKVK